MSRKEFTVTQYSWAPARLVFVALVFAACGGEPTPAEDGSTGTPDGGVTMGCESGTYDDDGDPSTACAAWTACEPGQYVSAAGTATSDQVCAGCVSGTFSASADARACEAWTTCAAGTFVTVEGSATADRACAECEPGTFTTDENQSMCVSADACAPGTVQLEPATAAMPAVCEACAAGEYCPGGDLPRGVCDADGDGTWDHDADPSTACAERTACAAGSAVAADGDATTDRACEACADGSFSAETNAASCSAWTECAAGEYVSNTPSATEDRTCAGCAAGTYSTTPDAPSCAPWTVCAAGESVAMAGSATADQTCAACESGSFSAETNAASCSPWTECVAGEYVSAAGSASADRMCMACAAGTYTSGSNQSVCVDVGACAPGTIQTAPGTSTAPPTCADCASGEYCAGDTAPAEPCPGGTWDHDADPATVCVARTTCSVGTFVAAEGDATTDRACRACASGEYSATENAPSCAAWAICVPGQYVSAAGSATADRTCTGCAGGRYSTRSNAPSCAFWRSCSAGSFVSRAPSSTRDRVCSVCAAGEFSTTTNASSCSAWTDCSAGSYVSAAGSAFSDRVCSACASGEYSTTINAPSCAPWTDCSRGTYASNTPSATVDRTCAACTAIANCALGLTCTTASDQTCGACAPGYLRLASGTICSLPWERQFGTSDYDYAYGVAVDGSGNVYVAGFTRSTLPGSTSAGSDDAFVRKYAPDGILLWTRQFGTSRPDYARAVAVDGSGNVYVAGYTGGTLPGSTSAGSDDAFVRKYAADGTALWTRQFGISGYDHAQAVAVDGSGNAYVAGFTNDVGSTSTWWNDAFVHKLDPDGNSLWTHQFGAVAEAFSVAVNASGDAYVAGYTRGALTGSPSAGGQDAFVRKLDADGNALWTRQFGTSSSDIARGVAVDASGNVYVAGETFGALEGSNAGSNDTFVRKLSTTGTALWTRQFGTSGSEFANAVAVDASGNVFIAGQTSFTLGGMSLTTYEVFVRILDGTGVTVWTDQRGTTDTDYALSVAPDGSGGAFVAGYTDGTWPGQTSAGSSDALLARFGP